MVTKKDDTKKDEKNALKTPKAAEGKTAKKPAAKHALKPKAEGKPAKKKATPKKTAVKHALPAPSKAEGKKPKATQGKAATKKEAVVKAEENAPEAKKGSYIATVGRRKTSIARVRLIKNGKGVITVNGRTLDQYFGVFEYRNQVREPLVVVGQADAVDVSVKVIGGGMRGQAEAIRMGISRALVQLNPTFRKSLKKLGFLSRDARKKERKKPGLKKARRAPQWSKR